MDTLYEIKVRGMWYGPYWMNEDEVKIIREGSKACEDIRKHACDETMPDGTCGHVQSDGTIY